MKYFKYFSLKIIKGLKNFLIATLSFWFIVFIMVLCIIGEGYTLEDFGIEGVTLNPNDYCTLTDVQYYGVLRNSSEMDIVEYITFDVHAASRSNPFKEVWRELPEDVVDGLRVTYDVVSVSQILDDGTEIAYFETPKMYWEDYDYTQSGTMRWHHSKGTGRHPDDDESLLIYIPWTYREKMTFRIEYTMNNAALKYKDCSELYLSLYSGKTITKLKSYKAQILVPNSLMPNEYHAYSYGTANSRIPFTESSSLNPGYYTFSIDLDESDLKFNYHNRYIEFCLLAYGEDKHIFTEYAPKNKYSSDNALDECIRENEYYENQNIIFGRCKRILFVSSIILGIFIVYNATDKFKKIKKKNEFYEPETDYEYFREIPSDLDPMFASELVFMKNPFDENREKKEEYAAILLSLMRKKYVTLTKKNPNLDWNDTNTVINLEPIRTYYKVDDYESPEPELTSINENTNEELEPLCTSERLYFELLDRYAGKIDRQLSIYDLQNRISFDYEHTNVFVKDMEKKPILENGAMLGYFRDAKYDMVSKKLQTDAKSSLVFSLLLLILGNGISYFTPLALGFGAYTILGIAFLIRYFYFTINASKTILFTQYGVNEQAKWCGLYNFLNSDTLINEKEVQDVALWERYLIYATAFGISEKVVKAIKIHAVEINIDQSYILNNRSYIHSHCFHHTSRAFGHSIHTSSRGGGGFAGHGYGGGGRGGGGGGGGH